MKVNELVDLGFHKTQAEHALKKCGGSAAEAAEYLLTQPREGST